MAANTTAHPLVRPPNAAIGFTQDDKGANHLLTGTGLRTLQDMAIAINGSTKGATSTVTLGNGQKWSSGPGNPNGAVAGNLGDIFTNTNGGAGSTLFIKETGGPGDEEWLEFQVNLDEALRDITQRITCVEWDEDENRENWKAPTGESYLELCSGGFKAAGETAPCLCLNKEVAVATWRAALLEYEAKRPGVLYWRVKPEFGSVEIPMGDDDATWWFIYSRLLISNRSVIRTVKRAAII